MEENNELKQALVEVRKAYRLIAAYQRRLIDMTKTIVNAFDYKAYWQDNDFFNIRGYGVATERWAIDLLPMYHGFFMLFLPINADANIVRKEDTILVVSFYNDTALPNEFKKDPETIDMQDNADTISQMRLYMCGVREDMDGNWLKNVFNQIEYPDNGKFIEDQNVWSAGKYYDLASIPDEKALNLIINDFKQFLGEIKQDNVLQFRIN